MEQANKAHPADGQGGRNLLKDLEVELKEGRGSTCQKLPEVLRNITDILYLKDNSTANAIALVHILSTLSSAAKISKSTFNSTVVADFISIASNVTNQTEDAKTNNMFDSSELMRSLETFSEFYQPPEKEFSLLLPNILLKGKIYEANSSDDYFQSFPGNYTAEIASKSLQASRSNNSLKISSIMYKNIDEFLPQSTEETLNKIQSTSLKMNNDNTRLNTELSITMFFPPMPPKKPNTELKTARCVFWSYEKSRWSPEGCKTTVSENGTSCECNHLTPFSVLMTFSKQPIPFLDEITYAGLTISIGSLLFFVTVEFVVWNTVVKSNVTHFRHTTFINIAIALLFAQFFFLIGAINLVKNNNTLCTIVTIFTHLFFLSVFFWTLTQSLTLLYRLLFVFHHVRKSVFMLFSFFVGYICPLMIVIAATTTFISKGKYKAEKICWLNATPSEEFTALHTFIIPVGCIIGINMLILTVVIVKLTRPSISEGMRNKEDKETMKKIIKAILILTPTFGLTWIVGFSLTEDSHDIEHYAFVLLNSTQGLFILITASVTENKVRETFIKHVKSMTSLTSSHTTFENVYSKTTSNSVGK
ncbi:adhesion G-protein coupled receptor F1 [Mustelus asterias]